MRTIAILMSALMLPGCIAWTGASELEFTDSQKYAGTVEAHPGFVVLFFPGDPFGPSRYTVAGCFDENLRAANKNTDFVPTIGSNPFKRVCRQYPGVDLATYPSEALSCFKTESGSDENLFRHPWLGGETGPVCQKLIDDISAKRMRENQNGA
ncbi:MAG: hypothetical protein AAB227_07400 [Pseudomonadota bacterium]